VYLAEVGRPFAAALFRLIGGGANKVADVAKEVDRAEQLSPSREPPTNVRTKTLDPGNYSAFALLCSAVQRAAANAGFAHGSRNC
jgi:hypothetical protein